MKRSSWLIGAVAVTAAALGIGVASWLRLSNPEPAAERALLALTLPDHAGAPQSLSQWPGKVRVVNFWGTWCPPCREEMPMLAASARANAANGVQFVGIALDSAEAVAKYAQETPTPYPLLVSGMELGPLMSQLGNNSQALPFTVFLGADDRLAHIKLGPLKEAELASILKRLAGPAAAKK